MAISFSPHCLQNPLASYLNLIYAGISRLSQWWLIELPPLLPSLSSLVPPLVSLTTMFGNSMWALLYHNLPMALNVGINPFGPKSDCDTLRAPLEPPHVFLGSNVSLLAPLLELFGLLQQTPLSIMHAYLLCASTSMNLLLPLPCAWPPCLPLIPFML